MSGNRLVGNAGELDDLSPLAPQPESFFASANELGENMGLHRPFKSVSADLLGDNEYTSTKFNIGRFVNVETGVETKGHTDPPYTQSSELTKVPPPIHNVALTSCNGTGFPASVFPVPTQTVAAADCPFTTAATSFPPGLH